MKKQPEVRNDFFMAICIPTYNRDTVLEGLLSTVCPQVDAMENADVCVVVSDDCSTDNTERVVKNFQRKFPSFFYHRNKENTGAFDNSQMVTSLTDAKYIWLLGDDDLLLPMSVAKVYETIKLYSTNDLSFIFLNSFSMDGQLKHIGSPSEGGKFKTKLYSPGPGLLKDFSFNSIGHMSRMIFKRAYWQNNSNYINRKPWEIYPQIKCVFDAIRDGQSLYIENPLVINCQRGNETCNTWKGRGVTYYCLELPNLVEFGINNYKFNQKIMFSQIKRAFKNIVIEHIKLNLYPATYKILFNDIESAHSGYWYSKVLLQPIRLILAHRQVREYAFSILERIYPGRKLPTKIDFFRKV